MRTGDGPTEDGGGATRNEENVIRLPRDWLGPPEELVPIGPAARARAARLEAEEGAPPAADAFWSEDSAALHDAVQAPRGAARERVSPPVGLVAPVAGQWQLRRPGLPRWADPRRMQIRWAMLVVPAAALLVVAAIGLRERAGTDVTTGHSGAAPGASHAVWEPAPRTSAAIAAAAQSLAKHAAATTHHQPRRATPRSRARPRAQTTGAPPARPHHRVSTTPHSAAAPTPAVTQASTPSQTSSGATSAATSTPVRTTTRAPVTASKPSSEASRSASPPGPTGIGSVSGGCTVKCS